MTETWRTCPEMAKEIGCSRSTIHRWVELELDLGIEDMVFINPRKRLFSPEAFEMLKKLSVQMMTKPTFNRPPYNVEQ